MEQDLLEYRRDIETAFKTALVSQMREIELNCSLKDTLCYSCWVNLRLVLSDAADNFQADPQQVRACCLARKTRKGMRITDIRAMAVADIDSARAARRLQTPDAQAAGPAGQI